MYVKGSAPAIALHRAVEARGRDALERLLDGGGDLRLRDAFGRSVVHRAVGRPDWLAWLVEHGAPLDTRDIDGYTPVALAVEGRRPDSARCLLDLGADPGWRGNGGQSLYDLSLEWIPEIADELVRRGVPTEPLGPREPTPLLGAIRHAPSSRHPWAVERLLDEGADLEQADARGITPLMAALGGGGLEMASPEDRPGAWGALVDLLHEGSVLHRSHTRVTILHAAAGSGHLAMVERCLEAGVEVDAESEYGRTPLHDAARCGHLTVVKRLLEAGASPEARDCAGQRPLHLAARGFRFDVLDALLAVSSQVDDPDYLGRRPLLLAARAGLSAYVEPLLEAGAMPSAPDTYGQTPLQALDAAFASTPSDLRRSTAPTLSDARRLIQARAS